MYSVYCAVCSRQIVSILFWTESLCPSFTVSVSCPPPSVFHMLSYRRVSGAEYQTPLNSSSLWWSWCSDANSLRFMCFCCITLFRKSFTFPGDHQTDTLIYQTQILWNWLPSAVRNSGFWLVDAQFSNCYNVSNEQHFKESKQRNQANLIFKKKG